MEPAASPIDVQTKARALLDGVLKRVQVAALAAALVPLGAVTLTPQEARASTVCGTEKHCTDGGFNLHMGGSPTSEGPEWTSVSSSGGVNTVTKLFFEVVGQTGGSWLYVEQGGGVAEPAPDNDLYLMYDWVNSPNVFPLGLSSDVIFDVFFQIPRENEDYVVRIRNNTIETVAEKSSDDISSLNPDGTFNLQDPVWTILGADDEDVQLADFKGAIGFGPSPNSSTPHIMAEFELTFDPPQGSVFGDPEGFYDPAPAFWSASAGALPDGGATLTAFSDPPISSAIFTLNPDGSTSVVPVLGPNGGPVQQIQQAVPEPSTLSLFGLGLLGFLASLRRRQCRSGRH